MSSCDIFISYRRAGGDMTAMYLYQALKSLRYNVFYDLEVLRSGKFNEALYKSIRACKDFVIILSPGALDRCVEEGDWVRMEIAEAIRSHKNIIPIMMNGFTFPEYLPEDIDEIRYQNGLSSTTEYFRATVEKLCARYLQSKPKQSKKKIILLLILFLFLAGCAAVAYYTLQNPEHVRDILARIYHVSRDKMADVYHTIQENSN
ncbi:MAG: toll/interleukin-1 receptor domain-containing protein [Clostridia bacterium]|nr:toll/interleukin-1 receptor domain-containing protein [Clostridia bacterium]